MQKNNVSLRSYLRNNSKNSMKVFPENQLYLYKYRMFINDGFNNAYESRMLPFSKSHSMLATLVLDYKFVENEHPIISQLRIFSKKLVEFSKSNKDRLDFKIECSSRFGSGIKEMVKHIFFSIDDSRICKDIDIKSLTYGNTEGSFYLLKKDAFLNKKNSSYKGGK